MLGMKYLPLISYNLWIIRWFPEVIHNLPHYYAACHFAEKSDILAWWHSVQNVVPRIASFMNGELCTEQGGATWGKGAFWLANEGSMVLCLTPIGCSLAWAGPALTGLWCFTLWGVELRLSRPQRGSVTVTVKIKGCSTRRRSKKKNKTLVSLDSSESESDFNPGAFLTACLNGAAAAAAAGSL